MENSSQNIHGYMDIFCSVHVVYPYHWEYRYVQLTFHDNNKSTDFTTTTVALIQYNPINGKKSTKLKLFASLNKKIHFYLHVVVMLTDITYSI